MKTYCLFFILFILNFNLVSAEIRNGYEKDLQSVRRSLKGLLDMVRDHNGLPMPERMKVQMPILLTCHSQKKTTRKYVH